MPVHPFGLDEKHTFECSARECGHQIEMAGRGYDPDVIELAPAHQDEDKVRAAYNRALRWPERQKLLQEWADILDQLKRADFPSPHCGFFFWKIKDSRADGAGVRRAGSVLPAPQRKQCGISPLIRTRAKRSYFFGAAGRDAPGGRDAWRPWNLGTGNRIVCL
jgi:hypothetical protein